MPDPYVCYRTPTPIRIDGKLEKPAWRAVPRSARFVDMVDGSPGLFDTRIATTWDHDNLYVAFWIEEPFLAAAKTQRDSLIFLENDVELFIDGGDCYYELEINAAGAIYEVLFVWQDAFGPGTRFEASELDVLKRGAMSFAGDLDRSGESFWQGTHRRGPRWAFRDWDLPGLRAAVTLQGTLNDDSDVDEGWQAELALPWSGFSWLANGRPVPPHDGDTWRVFFGRFEKLTLGGVEVQPHPAWVLTPHGVYDTHQPERWTEVRFSSQVAPAVGPA